MNAKQSALKDIQDELEKQNKKFIPFRKYLNKPMRKLVNSQLRQQGFKVPSRSTGQLVAHCFFMNSTEVKYDNYSKYYEK